MVSNFLLMVPLMVFKMYFDYLAHFDRDFGARRKKKKKTGRYPNERRLIKVC